MLYSRNDVKRIQKAISEGKSIGDALYGSEQDYTGSHAALYECLENSALLVLSALPAVALMSNAI